MTWQKTAPEIYERMAGDGLSLEAAMAHLQGLGYLYRQERDDCLLPRGLLASAMPMLEHPRPAVDELVRAGYWLDGSHAFEIRADAEVVRQSLVAQRAKREKDRRAQERARHRRSGSSTDDATDDGAAESSAPQASKQPSNHTLGAGSSSWPDVRQPGVETLRAVDW